MLQGVSEIPDFDIEAVGFSVDDLDSLLGTEPQEVVEDNFNPDGDVETRCKEGDLWQLGRHFLLCGDSTKMEDVERLLNGAKIDLLLTDPPYGVEAVKGNIKGKIGGGNIVESKTYKKIKGDSTTETARLAYDVSSELGISNFIIWGGNYFTDFFNSISMLGNMGQREHW